MMISHIRRLYWRCQDATLRGALRARYCYVSIIEDRDAQHIQRAQKSIIEQCYERGAQLLSLLLMIHR